MPAAKYDLFISYADADQAWVEGYLVDALKQGGIRYHSEAAFALGTPRILEFENAIQQSQRTLLVLSPAYLADGFNQFVNLLAQCYGLETATWPVIPLILQPVQLPPRLSILVQLNATNPEEWEKAIERLCADLKRPVPVASSKPPCPYPGMIPFSEDDSDRFFGRKREIEEVLERLRLHPFLTVIGPSGSGKSSLIFAGIIPHLRQTQRFGAGEWLVCTMRPGKTPLTNLKNLLGSNLTNPTQVLMQLLTTQPNAQRLLLVLDQLEEIFSQAGQEAIPFQERLLELAQTPNVYLILTVRADFYSDLMTSLLWHKIRAHRLEIVPLDEVGLRQAILKPADDVGVFVETALLERLVADAAGEPGVLPLIQETLVLLWEHVERRFLPLRAYEALVLPRSAYEMTMSGRCTGLQVAIARRADAALATLEDDPEKQWAIARRIFLRLIQFGEGRADTRRQQSVNALRATTDDANLFHRTLYHLADCRLLTLSGGEKEVDRQVDIAHEALISGWPTLQQWIVERRETEKIRRRLTTKAEEWVRLGKAEGGLLDEIELAEAQRWLESSDAADLGYDRALSELVEASQRAIEQIKQQEEEAQQRELNLIRESLEYERRAKQQEKRARQTAQTRNIIATTLSVILAGVATIAVLQSRNARISAIESSIVASESLFIAHKDIEALMKLIDTGQLLKQPFLPIHNVKVRFENHFAQLLAKLREQNRFQAHKQWVLSVSFNHDGRLVASASLDNTIKLWKRNGHLFQTLSGHKKGIVSVSFSPNGQTLASASQDNTVKIWRRQQDGTFTLNQSIQEQNWISSVKFSPDGETIATAGVDKLVKLWHLGKGTSERSFQGHTKPVMDVSFSPDGNLIASGSQDGTLRLWSIRDTSFTKTIQVGSAVYGVRFVDNKRVASASEDGTIKIWDLNGQLLIPPFKGHSNSILHLDVDPDGKMIASASKDGTVRVWDIKYGTLLQTIKADSNSVSEVNFSPNGKTIVSAGQDGTVRLWGLDGALLTLQGSSFSFSSDGQKIVSGDEDGSIKLWQSDGKLLKTIVQAHTESISKVRFSPNGQMIASASADGTVKLWQLDGTLKKTIGEENKNLEEFKNHVTDVVFSPNNKMIAFTKNNGKVQISSLDGILARSVNHGDSVTSVKFSSDSRIIASSGADGKVKLWQLNGQLINSIEGHEGGVLSISFNPDGKMIASSGADGTVKLWRLNGQQLRMLQVPNHRISSIKFSPNGQYLVSGSDDSKIRVWSLDGQTIKIFQGHTDYISDVDFSPNGKIIASTSFDEKIILWNLDFNDLLKRSCSWLDDYLITHPNLNEYEHKLCHYVDK